MNAQRLESSTVHIQRPRQGLFVCGTDTDVGKTYVAAGIARVCHRAGIRVGVYKPVASGSPPNQVERSDAFCLWEAAGRPGRLTDVCPQCFAAPLAPHLAARAEGRFVDPRRLVEGISVWSDYELVVVEGVGGLLSPVSEELYVADLAWIFRLPLLIVAPNRIGVVNQTLQTLVAAANLDGGLPVRGIVLNDNSPDAREPSRASNAQELSARCLPPLLAHIPWQGADELARVDWLGVVRDAAVA
jgi:dethiobiotin synthetase